MNDPANGAGDALIVSTKNRIQSVVVAGSISLGSAMLLALTYQERVMANFCGKNSDENDNSGPGLNTPQPRE